MLEYILKWINKDLKNEIKINSDTLVDYINNSDLIFMPIIENKYRKILIEEYLKTPSDDTVYQFFKNWEQDIKNNILGSVNKKVFVEICKQFNILVYDI